MARLRHMALHWQAAGTTARWHGLEEGQVAGWAGICVGMCNKLYVLEAGECDRQGFLKGYTCFSMVRPQGTHWENCPGGNRYTTCTCYDLDGKPGMPRQCGGRVLRLRPLRAALAAWRIGGIQALLAFVPQTRKG